MSVKISELPILDSLADNDVLAGVDTSANVTKKIELATLKDYIDTNTTYTAGANIDITNNVVSAPNVYNKTETDELLDEKDEEISDLQEQIDELSTIYNAFPTASGEGESVSLDGTAETKFKKIDLKGNTSQNGTPTPDTPIPVNVVSGNNSVILTGRNLFNEANIYKGYYSGGTGNMTEDNQYRTVIIDQLPPGTYTFSTTLTNCRILRWQTGYLNTDVAQNTNNLTFTTTETKRLMICFRKNPTSDITETFNTQVEMGSVVNPYLPYQDSNTYPINLPVENIFAKNAVEQKDNYYLNDNGVETYLNIIGYTTSFTKVKPSTQYTISGTISNANDNLRIYYYNSSKQWISRSGALNIPPVNFTTPSNCEYIQIQYQKNYVDFNTIQIEEGSKVNTFTPYGTTPIELCKIGDYQDYFYKNSGKWYWHREIRKIVLTGSENTWTYSSSYKYFQLNNTSLVNGKIGAGTGLSNYMECRVGNSKQVLWLFDTNEYFEGDLTTYKNWLSTHNTIAYYVLDTPTNTEITYQPLIEQLNNIEKAMSYNGQTNILQVSNDKPFIISAEAIMSLQNVLDRIELLES